MMIILKKNRWIGPVLCLCFIVATLSAAGFILTHADHDCVGEGCPVCLQIQWARSFAGNLGDALPRECPPYPLIARASFPPSLVFYGVCLTAVRLKVKMNA
jgi:hypothetical protein